ncbi:substrate-binding domain-containing protein [Mycoplasmatota bacterium]|nr:substrate-binding domain-containing protein [Mycoplasmatota bacterium]
MKKFMILIVISIIGLTVTACGQKANHITFDNSKMIDVVSREAGSGTRGAFEELVDFNIDKDKDGNIEFPMVSSAQIKDGNGNVATYVLDNKYSIGYVSFVTLSENPNLKGIRIGDVEPTVANVLNQTYQLARPFNMVYHSENLTSAETGFITFLASKEGLTQLEQAGAIVDKSNASSFNKDSCSAGTLVLGGSTSVEDAVKKAAGEYKAICTTVNQAITWSYDATGSSTGISNGNSGAYHIGYASRELKASEMELGMTEKAVAMDGIAIVVNKENPLDDLSMTDIQSIYTQSKKWEDFIK